MEPLSAARMESGSYQRGYDFIIRWGKIFHCDVYRRQDYTKAYLSRLHILHELEDCLSNVFHGDNCDMDHNNIDTMLTNLQKRLTITRVSHRL